VTLRPCLIRTYLQRYLGAKVCRKVCKFICQTICCSFGRYRPLGKAQSHLQGGPPTRYQNKVNLHAKRSAKQLQWGKVGHFAGIGFLLCHFNGFRRWWRLLTAKTAKLVAVEKDDLIARGCVGWRRLDTGLDLLDVRLGKGWGPAKACWQ
jgi:hypothetical protein